MNNIWLNFRLFKALKPDFHSTVCAAGIQLMHYKSQALIKSLLIFMRHANKKTMKFFNLFTARWVAVWNGSERTFKNFMYFYWNFINPFKYRTTAWSWSSEISSYVWLEFQSVQLEFQATIFFNPRVIQWTLVQGSRCKIRQLFFLSLIQAVNIFLQCQVCCLWVL